MRHKIFCNRAIRHVAIVLVLAATLIPLSTSPVAAQGIGDYFVISYNFALPAEVHGNEVFYCTVTGTATCIKDLDLPISISGVRFTFRVVGEPQAGGDAVTLNSSYTITIMPFPDETTDPPVEINEVIPLRFPEGSESGVYDVIGELIKAEAKVPILGWRNIEDFIEIPPGYRTLDMGSVTYIAPPNNPPNPPGTPSPANHATGVSIYADLSWTGGDPDPGDTVTYDVYFGTSATPPLVSPGQTGTTYDPGTLNHDTTYYWKIIAEDNHGAPSDGPLWDFVTRSNTPPNMPGTPSPANHATGVSIYADLSWTGGDPDPGDTVTYDVYFGTSATPPLVSPGQTGTSYNLGTLSYNTKYYWKIIAEDNHGASTTGPVWDFTTAPPNTPPNTPSAPSGPGSGYTGTSYSYSTSATDPDWDQVKYTFDWGDGTTSETGLVSSGTTASKSHSWSNPGTYYVKAKATDSKGASSEWSDSKAVTISAPSNTPPNTPSTPSGPGSGDTGTSYSYSTSATDPDGDQVKYTFDWGDGTTSETGLVNSGTTASESHSWSSPGTYYVKAKATDSEGAPSGWSNSKKVTISATNNPPYFPSNPLPENHATDVPTDADLSWAGGDPDHGDTVTYDVYFGTSATPPLVSNGQTGTSYDPGTLQNYTTYYWRIVARDNHTASTTGPLWDFTTVWDPLIYDVNPKNGEIEKMEAIQAVKDYFDGVITKMQAIEVVRLYFE